MGFAGGFALADQVQPVVSTSSEITISVVVPVVVLISLILGRVVLTRKLREKRG